MSARTKSKTKALPPVEELPFETAYEELESIARQLENGEPALEEALALFERGQALAGRCQALLDAAELKVQQLAPRPGGQVELLAFEEPDEA